MRRRTVLVVAAVLAMGLLASCGDDDDGGESSADEKAAVEQVIRATVAAEKAKDADAFLALWTDKGLGKYDVGSRAEIKSGETEFGQDTDAFELVKISTTVDDDTATATVDGKREDVTFAQPLFRLKYDLINKDDKWLIDGFEFLGSPPAAAGTPVLNVKALDYAFSLDPAAPPALFQLKFTNAGKEQHEIALFKAPAGIKVLAAKDALQNVDGRELKAPAGYEATHLAFTEPGESSELSFAAPLVPGTYVLACFIPQGGVGDEGPVNPEGKPHIQLGMLSVVNIAA